MKSYQQVNIWNNSKHQCGVCGIYFEGTECPYCGIAHSSNEDEGIEVSENNFI